jgi:hypothetical protein
MRWITDPIGPPDSFASSFTNYLAITTEALGRLLQVGDVAELSCLVCKGSYLGLWEMERLGRDARLSGG